VGASVKEAYVTLLELAVVLQLLPFLYLYAALVRLPARAAGERLYFQPATLRAAGCCGLATTALGMVVAFVPSREVTSVWLFELKMLLGSGFFLALAGLFFFSSRARVRT
jgi:hypothetical protein